jgi:hypothetical protein
MDEPRPLDYEVQKKDPWFAMDWGGWVFLIALVGAMLLSHWIGHR